MKHAGLALFIALALGLAAVPAVSQEQPAAGEPIDFIRLDGAVYLSMSYLGQDDAAGPLDASELGPAIGQVGSGRPDPADEAAFPNEPCLWDLPDGVAPRLLSGDEIFAVRGYATSFRLATRHEDEVAFYQVWCSDDALVGADLFDIYGRVVSISVTGDLTESSGFAVIDDPATLAGLTEMLLSGRIVPDEESSGAPVTHQLIIELDDGTSFRASTSPGEFLWGTGVIEAPAAFEDELAATWERAQG